MQIRSTAEYVLMTCSSTAPQATLAFASCDAYHCCSFTHTHTHTHTRTHTHTPHTHTYTHTCTHAHTLHNARTLPASLHASPFTTHISPPAAAQLHEQPQPLQSVMPATAAPLLRLPIAAAKAREQGRRLATLSSESIDYRK